MNTTLLTMASVYPKRLSNVVTVVEGPLIRVGFGMSVQETLKGHLLSSGYTDVHRLTLPTHRCICRGNGETHCLKHKYNTVQW